MAASDLLIPEQSGLALDFTDNTSAMRVPFSSVYPSAFPGPIIEAFSANVGMGVIRSESSIHQAQRRVFTTMPQTFSMVFILDVEQWAEWQQWAGAYGYRWFEMKLPTLYAGADGQRLAPTIIRFVSSFSAVSLSQTQFQINVTAETAPSMIAQYLRAA